MPLPHPTRGQASVELVATLPVLGLLVLSMLQAAFAGYAAWSATTAARAGARAAAVGKDPVVAVRRAAPLGGAAAGVVRREDAVVVALPIPRVLPVDLGRVTGRAHLEPQR
jgi:hypothetical protein